MCAFDTARRKFLSRPILLIRMADCTQDLQGVRCPRTGDSTERKVAGDAKGREMALQPSLKSSWFRRLER